MDFTFYFFMYGGRNRVVLIQSLIILWRIVRYCRKNLCRSLRAIERKYKQVYYRHEIKWNHKLYSMKPMEAWFYQGIFSPLCLKYNPLCASVREVISLLRGIVDSSNYKESLLFNHFIFWSLLRIFHQLIVNVPWGQLPECPCQSSPIQGRKM